MEFYKHSGLYSFKTTQLLPVSLEYAWHFFSTPKNLQKLTPDTLDFKITGPPLTEIFQGQIITYSIRIFPPFRTNWVTEITSVETHKCFVDEQRYGPYKMWHHLHQFEEVEGGVLMTDQVHFKLPFALLAPIAYRLFIKKKLRSIFDYRKVVLDEMLLNNTLK